MATDNKDNKLSIGGGDYAEILRQAVAVIGHDKKVLRSVALLYLSDKSVRRISSYPIWTQGKGRKQHALKGRTAAMNSPLPLLYPSTSNFQFPSSAGS